MTLVLQHPASAGTSVRFGALRADGSTRWGAPEPVPAGALTVTDQHPPGAAIGLSAQVVTGSLPPQRAVISVAGHPYELSGSLSSALVPGPWQLAGLSQGYAVFTLRKPAEPVVASTANGRRLPVQIVASTTKSEDVRVHAPSSSTVDPFGGLGLGLDRNGLGGRGRGQGHPGQRLRSRPAGAYSGRRRPDLVPLQAAASVAGQHPQPRLDRVLVGPARRLAGAAAATPPIRDARMRRLRKARRPQALLRRCRHPSAEDDRRSAERVRQGEEELSVFGAPHSLNDETGLGELALQPVRA